MFGIVADLLCTVATIIFPIFASYKALRTSDPAQLAPWLMYWVVLSLALTAESFVYFIVSWFPFYSWIRLFAYLYLILPGQQGATFLYLEHIEPFLQQHEAEIDTFITKSHDRAKIMGFQYLQQVIEYIRVNILGLQPSPPPGRGSQPSETYMQSFLSRFSLPTARAASGAAGPASDIYNLVAQALSGASSVGGTRDVQAADISVGGTLIPPELRGADNRDQLSYVATQRERLRVLLQAFDREAYNLASAPDERKYGGLGAELGKSRSELDFDRIDRDEAAASPPYQTLARRPEGSRRESSGWMPWNWGSTPPRPQVPPEAVPPPPSYSGEYAQSVLEEEEIREREKARRRRDREERRREAESSGLDYGY